MIPIRPRCRFLMCMVFASSAVVGCSSVTSGKDQASSDASSANPGPAVVLNFRPVVMPPVAWPRPSTPTTSPAPAKKTADPLRGLSFPVPIVDTAYYKLTPAQQRQLQTRLAIFDCSSDQRNAAAQPLIACDRKEPSKAKLVYLLGAVIVPGTAVAKATAIAPTVSNGGTDWAVWLELDADGARAWAKYTGAHNTGGQNPGEPITGCGASATPCADYVAVTVDGAVISSPYLRDVIEGEATQISGNFTAESARKLADQLSR